ncbi:MAG: Chromosome partition protein Smc [Chlamydiales bacterium]|nr:Chromosome partition protein Smc [Chlamydiales bacterium]MCH9619404.1 Chromosome partition protein Smc [Chlamydiales bacterium]MCH9622208.1 Chromosome partition protein Smc [Chlamydiales bacterium]
MRQQTYTEEEFKHLLKNLFVEKKRVRQLQKKFQSKLSGVHDTTSSREYTKVKKECEILRRELLKVRSVIEQLKEERRLLKERPQGVAQEDFDNLQDQGRKEVGRLESEKSKLVEKLAESISQNQRQAEIVKDLHDEINKLREKNGELKEELDVARASLEEKEELFDQIKELEAAKEVLSARLEEAEKQLAKSDVITLHQEVATLQKALSNAEENSKQLTEDCADALEDKLQLKQQLKEKNEEHGEWEQEKIKLQSSLQNLRLQYEEQAQEVRKAQQHLAKKVKEATLLDDQVEKNKMQTVELEQSMQQYRREFERLQAELVEQKEEVSKLQKVKKQYEDVSSTLTDLKSFLGKSFEG